MQIRQRDGTALKLVITGMIVSHQVLAKVAAVWRPGLFGQKWADLIASWCIDWYKYNARQAPGKNIEYQFRVWAEDNSDEADEKAVAAFLGGLSDSFDPTTFNADYVVDLASQVINRNRLTEIRNRLDAALAVNDLDRAEAALQSPRVEVGIESAVDVFAVPHLIREAVMSRTTIDPVVRFEGALGNFTELLFERESFVAFQGSDKSGKSFCLQEVAYQGVLQGRRVAFFSCGDLSEVQMMRRIVCRVLGRPLAATKPGEVVRYPTFIEVDGDSSKARVTFDKRTFPAPVDPSEAWQQFKLFRREGLGGKKDLFRLSTHASETLSVAGLRAVLDRWKDDGWVPDVVVIDYADILAPPAGKLDSKQAIAHNWSALRAMSISDHNLVITATQADSEAYSLETMGRRNFSGAKEKNAHVTAMIGINQTPLEKDQEIRRLNLIVGRESPLTDQQCLHVAGCLAVANPFILSTF